MMDRPLSEFHERGGWYFTRLRDGSVRIRWSGDGTGRDVVHIIPANSWDSIVQHLRATSAPSSQPASEPNIEVHQAIQHDATCHAAYTLGLLEGQRIADSDTRLRKLLNDLRYVRDSISSLSSQIERLKEDSLKCTICGEPKICANGGCIGDD